MTTMRIRMQTVSSRLLGRPHVRQVCFGNFGSKTMVWKLRGENLKKFCEMTRYVWLENAITPDA